MATDTETSAALNWLVARLKADSALSAVVGSRIYPILAPDGAVTPYVTIAPMSQLDTLTENKTRVYQDAIWLIKGVGEAFMFGTSLNTIAQRLDALLGKVIDSNTTAYILQCHRLEEVTYGEPLNGVFFIHHGARFRVGTQLK